MKLAFVRYLELLLAWNQKINLTAITDPHDIQVKHFEDSLALLPHLGQTKSVIDLGSGAGFPGLPIAIERPELSVVLVEATRKKVGFLHAAIAALQLPHVSAVQGRAEDPKLQHQLGTFDLVVSRATWSLAEFLPRALPYCAPHGKMVAMKGVRWEEEVAAARSVVANLHLFEMSPIPYTLSSGEKRALLMFQVSAVSRKRNTFFNSQKNTQKRQIISYD